MIATLILIISTGIKNIYSCYNNISETKISINFLSIVKVMKLLIILWRTLCNKIAMVFEKHVILIKLFVREAIKHRYAIFNFILLESK